MAKNKTPSNQFHSSLVAAALNFDEKSDRYLIVSRQSSVVSSCCLHFCLLTRGRMNDLITYLRREEGEGQDSDYHTGAVQEMLFIIIIIIIIIAKIGLIIDNINSTLVAFFYLILHPFDKV